MSAGVSIRFFRGSRLTHGFQRRRGAGGGAFSGARGSSK
jgi:hypothetical protein